MNDFQTNTVPPGIYTVWIEGESGNPYYQQRRVAVPVRIQKDANADGDYNDAGDVKVTRDFSLINSVLDGSTPTLGASISMPIYVNTTSASSTRWNGGAVSLSWDTGSFTNCSMNPDRHRVRIDRLQRRVGDADHRHRRPLDADDQHDRAGAGLLHVHAARARGTNGDGQPVTHLQLVRFTVATTTSSGQYVDIIGFTVFQIDDITSNDILGHAITGVYADPNNQALRRAQRARLVPWT